MLINHRTLLRIHLPVITLRQRIVENVLDDVFDAQAGLRILVPVLDENAGLFFFQTTEQALGGVLDGLFFGLREVLLLEEVE